MCCLLREWGQILILHWMSLLRAYHKTSAGATFCSCALIVKAQLLLANEVKFYKNLGTRKFSKLSLYFVYKNMLDEICKIHWSTGRILMILTSIFFAVKMFKEPSVCDLALQWRDKKSWKEVHIILIIQRNCLQK